MRDSVVGCSGKGRRHHGDVIVALGARDVKMPKVNAKTHPHTAAIAAKLKTEQGDAAYRRRKSIVEAPNGWIKAVMGLRQFSMRAWTRCKPVELVYGAKSEANGVSVRARRLNGGGSMHPVVITRRAPQDWYPLARRRLAIAESAAAIVSALQKTGHTALPRRLPA